MIKKILKYCRSKGIFHLDTAFDYDFNLKLLGDKQWEIDTKIIIKDDKNFLEKISEKINSIVNIKNLTRIKNTPFFYMRKRIPFIIKQLQLIWISNLILNNKSNIIIKE